MSSRTEQAKDICPYCNERPKIKETCGEPECQHARKLEQGRKYFNKFIRKTDRRVSSVFGEKNHSVELATR